MLKKTLNRFIKKIEIVNNEEASSKLTYLKKLSFSFLFIHIPKTAGTSFRKSVEEQYPSIGDYGKDSIHTSEVVKEHCYKAEDFYVLKELFNKDNQILSGHFLSKKYLDFVNVRQIISFVREPFEQVISHYNHYVAHLGYKGGFDAFIKVPRHCNIQSRYLNSLPVSLYGFIGLTANYEESLGFINQNYGLQIDVLQDNVGQKKVLTKNLLTTKQIETIEANNSKDIILFKQVEILFKQRVNYQENKLSWVHGWGTINPKNLLIGCAYYQRSDEVVQLELFINNKSTLILIANIYTSLYMKAKFPRARYVGFHVNLNNFKYITQVQLKVKETGQIIFEQIS
jgi:hypothetical protein